MKTKNETEKNRINSETFEDYDMENLWEDHEDSCSLKSLILFGIKGMAAYAYHALALGKQTERILQKFYHKIREKGLLLKDITNSGSPKFDN